MIILYILFALTILATIILYLKQTDKGERFKIASLSMLLQTIFVFITLWITVYTIRSGNSDTKELFNNLNSFNSQLVSINTSFNVLSENLREMPDQLKKFSNTIDTLNFIIKKQNEDFKSNTEKLNISINNLTQSVAFYEKNISSYNQQLSKIVELTDKQLDIWKEQQRVLLDEFSRKPILGLKPKEFVCSNDSCTINDLLVINDGNIEANTRVLFLLIPSESQAIVNSSMFNYYKKQGGFTVYRLLPLDTNLEILAAGADIIIPCTIKIPLKYRHSIEFSIDFYSKYNSGRVSNKIILQ